MSNAIVIHRGKIIQKAIKESGIKISELSKRLGKSRQFIYDMFEKEVIPLYLVRDIGTIIKYNFSNEIPELPIVLEFSEKDINWKDKYISLLEEYNNLLKKYL